MNIVKWIYTHRHTDKETSGKTVAKPNEIIIDTTENRAVLHDGVKEGGFPIAKLEEIREVEEKIANIKTELLIEIAKGTEAWNATTEYEVGDYVIHGDTIYRARTKHTGITPSTTTVDGLNNWSDILAGYVKLNKDGQYLKSIINFENFPVIDASKISTGYVPTATNQLTNKKYVDEKIAADIYNIFHGTGQQVITNTNFADVTVGDVDIFPKTWANDEDYINKEARYTLLRKGVIRILFTVNNSKKQQGSAIYPNIKVYHNDTVIFSSLDAGTKGTISIDRTVAIGDVVRFESYMPILPLTEDECYLSQFMLRASAKSVGELPIAWLNAPLFNSGSPYAYSPGG
jgi:hypothetical protein